MDAGADDLDGEALDAHEERRRTVEVVAVQLGGLNSAQKGVESPLRADLFSRERALRSSVGDFFWGVAGLRCERGRHEHEPEVRVLA